MGRKNKNENPKGPFKQTREGSPQTYILKIYVCGMTFKSTLAIENIQRICHDFLTNHCDLEIIDILKQPSQARAAQIIATPTVIKIFPLPEHRLIGDMSRIEKVLSGLDVKINSRQDR